MPEKYCATITCRLPTSGKFYCLPLAAQPCYELACDYIFSSWANQSYLEEKILLRGSLVQGGLYLGQRPVSHCGLRGDVVFNLPYLPLADSSDVMRIGSSLSYGKCAYFGGNGQLGILMPSGPSKRPRSGVFSTSGGSAIRSIEYSLPFPVPYPPAGLIGQKGHQFTGMASDALSVSYICKERLWSANPRSDGSGFISAGGFRRDWAVSVVLNLTTGKFYCTARTIFHETVKVVGGQLVWSSASALSNDRTLNIGSTVTSSAFGASFYPRTQMIAAVNAARSWAAVDQYQNEHRQARNDALDEYRALRSNNVENALQWSKVEKLLPLDAARHAYEIQTNISLPKSSKALLFAKVLSAIYLWKRYVVNTTYRDLKQILTDLPTLLPKEGPRTLKGRVSTSREYDFPNSTWVAATCRVDPYDLSLLPMRWGVHPGLSQAWDLLPFSFVVDWIFGVSNQLNAIDWFIYRQLLKLQYLVRGRRTEVVVDSSVFGGVGTITVAQYVRTVENTWPGLLDSIPNPRSVPIKNWATAAAALAISLW